MSAKRDLVGKDYEGDCSAETPQKAVARGSGVYVGNKLIRHFDEMSDDYAYTNAREYAEQWNKRNR